MKTLPIVGRPSGSYVRFGSWPCKNGLRGRGLRSQEPRVSQAAIAAIRAIPETPIVPPATETSGAQMRVTEGLSVMVVYQ
jgi:hypothetical protein